jgi:hypothetical protein
MVEVSMLLIPAEFAYHALIYLALMDANDEKRSEFAPAAQQLLGEPEGCPLHRCIGEAVPC